MAVQETDGRQTAMRIDMNSDMGESFGRWTLGDDEALLDVVSSANVACACRAPRRWTWAVSSRWKATPRARAR